MFHIAWDMKWEKARRNKKYHTVNPKQHMGHRALCGASIPHERNARLVWMRVWEKRLDRMIVNLPGLLERSHCLRCKRKEELDEIREAFDGTCHHRDVG